MSKKISSIKRRLLTMNVAGSCLLIITILSIFATYTAFKARQTLITELNLYAKIAAKRIAPALSWEDSNVINSSLEDFKMKESILTVCIYDNNNKLTNHFERTKSSKCKTTSSGLTNSYNWSIITLFSEMQFGNETVGWIAITSDLSDIKREVPNFLLFILFLMVATIVIAFILAEIFQKPFVGPILNLLRTTEDVIINKNYNNRAKKFYHDEIGKLTDSFNKMMYEIELRDATITEAKNTLEQKVEERTHELEEAKIRAEAASEAKTEFLRNMSHEFRTPLHGMLSFASFGVKESMTGDREKLLRYFQRIITVTERLTKLVDGILAIARLESGIEIFKIYRHNLFETVESACAETQKLALNKNIQVILNKPSFDCTAYYDSNRIIQVVVNIIGNAIKFTPENKKIEISFKEYIDQNGIIMIATSISDEGPGIPDDEICHIFEKFTQSSRTNTGAGGTGLGLAIAKNIMEGHEGTITAENCPLRGTTFTFLMPKNLQEGPKKISLNSDNYEI